jgi:hypothetical protein
MKCAVLLVNISYRRVCRAREDFRRQGKAGLSHRRHEIMIELLLASLAQRKIDEVVNFVAPRNDFKIISSR